jgi:hypothetical protein
MTVSRLESDAYSLKLPDRPVGPSDGDFRMSNHQTLFHVVPVLLAFSSVYLADFCENAVHDFRSRWSMFLRAQPTRIQLSYESALLLDNMLANMSAAKLVSSSDMSDCVTCLSFRHIS